MLKRTNWEFYAVLEGRCAPFNSYEERPPLKSRYLWAFPRGSHHGWTGEPHRACKVACFHFAFVPEILEKLLTEAGPIGRNITDGEAVRLKNLADELEPDYLKPTTLSHLLFNQALFELSRMVLTEMPVEQLESSDKRDALRVEAAIRWYRENLADKPSVADVAKSINMSSGYLRQLFLQVCKENPHQRMDKIRLQHATELLTGTDFKLDHIASISGYVSSSDFCRVFKAAYGMTPDKWRKSIMPPHDPNAKYTYHPSDGSRIFLKRKPNLRKRSRLIKAKT